MDFMLQRKTDSSANYGTPLVVSKKGWFRKFFDHKKIAEKIPVITSKVPDQNEIWSKLKYLARIEAPIRIVGVVVLGTLLGAAYAVTIKNGDKQSIKEPVSSIISQEVVTQELTTESVMPIVHGLSTPSENILSNENETSSLTPTTLKEAEISDVMNEFSFSQVTTIPEVNDKVILTLKSPEINQDEIKVASAFKLVSTEKSFKITHPKGFNASKRDIDETTYTAIVIPEELIPDVLEEEAGLSEYEQQRIMELEKKLALAQKKLDKFDMENLKLQGKFETLVVKNRALSDQLRHIDTVTTELKSH